MDKTEFRKLVRECIVEVLRECAECGCEDHKEEEKEKDLKEMTGTSAAQGFMGKNWVDPDPKRTKMKNIAAKSVGGKVA